MARVEDRREVIHEGVHHQGTQVLPEEDGGPAHLRDSKFRALGLKAATRF